MTSTRGAALCRSECGRGAPPQAAAAAVAAVQLRLGRAGAAPVLQCRCRRCPLALKPGLLSAAPPAPPPLCPRFTDKPGGMKLVKASVPLSEMFNYVSTLRGMSKGRAQYTMQVRYAPPVLPAPGVVRRGAGALARLERPPWHSAVCSCGCMLGSGLAFLGVSQRLYCCCAVSSSPPGICMPLTRCTPASSAPRPPTLSLPPIPPPCLPAFAARKI